MVALLLPLIVIAAESDFEGRWRLDIERSSALDGWSAMDLLITINGSEVEIGHDMRWRRTTRIVERNVVDTAAPTQIENFFRIEQRHMGVYPSRNSLAAAQASWIDEGRTLRTEVDVSVEVSQGDSRMRIYSEYRVGEGGETLTLIELHSTRNNPLVYRFRKLANDDNSRP